MSRQNQRWIAALLLTTVLCSPAYGKVKRKRVEAVEGKRYLLHKLHDPWMVMVTSLRDVAGSHRVDGLSSWEAADAIVYALREKRIPAYAFHQKQQMDERGRFIQRQEYIAIQRRKANENAIKGLKARYRIVIERDATKGDKIQSQVAEASGDES